LVHFDQVLALAFHGHLLACFVVAFVRPRFGTAPIEWHPAIVDALLVARLGAEPLLPGASRLDVTVAAISTG